MTWQTNTAHLEKVWQRRVADRVKAGNTARGNADNNPMTAACRICRDDAAAAYTCPNAELIEQAELSAANFARDIGAAIDPYHPPFHPPMRDPREWVDTLATALTKIHKAKIAAAANSPYKV